MRLKPLAPILAMTFFAFSCQQATTESATTETEEETMQTDPHSYAHPDQAIVTHLNWEADVDFDKQQIVATATWDIETGEDAREIIFDTYGLEIKSVTTDGQDASFKLGSFEEELGRPLIVEIGPETKQVSIAYNTTDSARALQFLDPEQTAGKEVPFLFTQSQAILARSWVPTQDSPGIRFTYEAKVTVPDNMIALMSAENPKEKNETGSYTFRMPQPIPSYLLALSAGDVEFQAISERTGVYAEPALLEKSAYEFADLEKMVQAAEGLYGPYAWGQYDIIVLPPSFPFGGMENPRLTFATPTILAGDRSLVSLVAHELAHSWSGNLVTNATWDDFWLNEGFTVYFEHRIMEEVYGREYSEMLSSLTREELIRDAEEMMKDMPDDTKLKLDLSGRNPDDGVTSIPYNKGYFFLRLMEESVGREAFDKFLKNYFEENKFKVMTTEEFLDHLKSDLLTEQQYADLKVDEWVYERGLPDNLPEVPSERFQVVETQLSTFLTDGTLPSEELTSAWTTHEWLHFINSMPEDISAEQLGALDNAFGFTQSGNSEIVAAWFQPTIRNAYEPVYPRVKEFLVSVGRRKFLTPTYRALIESDQKEMAMDIYQEARPNYHAVSRDTMDELLGYEA
jgi:leukotriene-A4 hydrolase